MKKIGVEAVQNTKNAFSGLGLESVLKNINVKAI